MSTQMGWRSALEALKTEAPLWGHLIPQIPRLLHEALQSAQQNSRLELEIGLSRLIAETTPAKILADDDQHLAAGNDGTSHLPVLLTLRAGGISTGGLLLAK